MCAWCCSSACRISDDMLAKFVNDLEYGFELGCGHQCVLKCYNEKDIDAIYALEIAANPHPWSKRNFIDSIGCSHLCVGVQVGDSWVAQAIFSAASGEAELLLISVDPVWQGKGIARKVLEVMSEIMVESVTDMYLEVRASNEGAIALYESCGFNCLGVRPGYYPAKKTREDALIYGKALTKDL